MSLQLNRIISFDDLAKGVRLWSDLLDRGGSTNIYSHPLWHVAWWRSRGTSIQMEILVAVENGRWVGILPLAHYRSLKDGFVKVLEFSGGSQADRHELITVPGFEQRVLELFKEPFERLKQKSGKVRLHNISEDSCLLKWEVLTNGTSRIESESSPFLRLKDGLTYEELEKEWSSSHRNDVRRQIKRLKALGELSLKIVEEEKEAIELLDTFYAVHTKKWKKKNLMTIIYNRKAKKFTGELIKNLWKEGVIHFSTLNLNDIPISYHFGYLFKRRFYWYKPAYVLEYENYSPGKVHIAKLLDEGVRQRWQVFDFLLGGEKYKYLWGKSDEKICTVIFGA